MTMVTEPSMAHQEESTIYPATCKVGAGPCFSYLGLVILPSTLTVTVSSCFLVLEVLYKNSTIEHTIH